MNNVKLHFYSERGIINSIIFWMAKEDKKNICKLLKTIKINDDESIFKEEDFEEINIYDEFSFGDFGSPDLIIKVKTHKNYYLFIIEAKIGTYLNSAIEKNEAGEIDYKGNASKINVQLSLRKRFMDLDKNVYEETPKNNNTDYKRKLQKESLINWVNDHLKNQKYNKYYISLTNDTDNPYTNEKYNPLNYNENTYGYWLYKDIKEILGEYDEYNNAWNYTIGKQEKDIQIKREKWDDEELDKIINDKFNPKYELVSNKTAKTIKYSKGNAIMRIWQSTKKDKYLLEIIDKIAFFENFDVDSENEINGYYIISSIDCIKLKENGD